MPDILNLATRPEIEPIDSRIDVALNQVMGEGAPKIDTNLLGGITIDVNPPNQGPYIQEGFAIDKLKPIAGYEEFKSSYAKEFDPEATDMQNIRPYATRQPLSEWWGNAAAKTAPIIWNSFMEGWYQNGRNFQALAAWDKTKLYSEDNTLAQMEEDRYKYPTFGRGELDNSAWKYAPWNLRSSDFYGEMLPQLGFTIGTMGQAILENMAIAWATGGIGNALNSSKNAWTAARLGQGFVNLYEAANGIKNLKRGLTVLSSLQKEGMTIGKVLGASGKMLANGYAMFNTAAAEGSFEASHVLAETEQHLIDKFVQQNGYQPFGNDLDKIRDTASKAATATFGWNLPILLTSNLVQFGNIIKPFKPATSIANTLDDIAMKATKSGVEVIKPNKWLNYAKGFGRFFMEGVSEGLEETAQSLVSNTSSKYYEYLAEAIDPRTSLNTALSEAFDYVKTREGFDEFMGGFLGGTVFKGVGYVTDKVPAINRLLNRTSKKDKESLKQMGLDILNTVSAKDILRYVQNPDVENYIKQLGLSKEMQAASLRDDRISFNDAKLESIRNFIYAGLQTGKLDVKLSTLELMKELTDEELATQFGISLENTQEIANKRLAVNEYVDNITKTARNIEQDFKAVEQKYGNRFDPITQYDNFQAWEQAKKVRVFTRAIAESSKQEAAKLINRVTSKTEGRINSNMFSIIVDQNLRTQYSVNLIQDYIDKVLKPFTEVPLEEQSPIIKNKLKELEIFTKIDEMLKKGEIDYNKIAQELYKLNTSDQTQEINFDEEIKNQSIKDIEEALIYEAKNRDAITAYNYLNGKGFEEVYNKNLKAQKELEKVPEKVLNEEKPDGEVAPVPPPINLGEEVDYKELSPEEFVEQINSQLPEGFIPKLQIDNNNINAFEIPKYTNGLGVNKDKSYNLTKEQAITILKELSKDSDNYTRQKEEDVKPDINSDNSNKPIEEVDEMLNRVKDIEGKNKPIELYPISTSSLNWEDRNNSSLQEERAWMTRTQYFYNNLINKKLKRELNQVLAIPVTDINITKVEEKLGLQPGELKFMLNPEYLFSTNKLSGHINYIYVNKTKEDTYELLDQDGNVVTENYKDNIVRSRHSDRKIDPTKTTQTDKLRGWSNMNEDQRAELVKDIENTGNKIAEYLSKEENAFVELPFAISQGIQNIAYIDPGTGNKTSKIAYSEDVKTNPTVLFDVDRIGEDVKIVVFKNKNVDYTKDEFTGDYLITGRPYLRIDQPKFDSKQGKTGTIAGRTYHYLDNFKLSDFQKAKLKESILTILESGDLSPSANSEYVRGVINAKIGDNKKPIDSKYQISIYKKAEEKNSKGEVIKESKILVNHFDFNTNTFTYSTAQQILENPDLLDVLLNQLYHKVDTDLLNKKGTFKDLTTGEEHPSYTHYLIGHQNAPLSIRLSPNVKNDNTELARIQKYSILDYSKVDSSYKPSIKETKKEPQFIFRKKAAAQPQSDPATTGEAKPISETKAAPVVKTTTPQQTGLERPKFSDFLMGMNGIVENTDKSGKLINPPMYTENGVTIREALIWSHLNQIRTDKNIETIRINEFGNSSWELFIDLFVTKKNQSLQNAYKQNPSYSTLKNFEGYLRNLFTPYMAGQPVQKNPTQNIINQTGTPTQKDKYNKSSNLVGKTMSDGKTTFTVEKLTKSENGVITTDGTSWLFNKMNNFNIVAEGSNEDDLSAFTPEEGFEEQSEVSEEDMQAAFEAAQGGVASDSKIKNIIAIYPPDQSDKYYHIIVKGEKKQFMAFYRNNRWEVYAEDKDLKGKYNTGGTNSLTEEAAKEVINKYVPKELSDLLIESTLKQGSSEIQKEFRDGKISQYFNYINSPSTQITTKVDVQVSEERSKVNEKLVEEIGDDIFDDEETKLESTESEPITEQEFQELKNMVKLRGFELVNAERMLGDRRVWGTYKNGVIKIYLGAKKGTAYHEAFELVYNSILTEQQQNKLYEDFKKREGEFTTYLGETKLFSEATQKEAKENMADEFIDFKQKDLARPEVRNMFQRIWNFVKDFIRRFIVSNKFLRENSTPTVEKIYQDLAKGFYKDVEVRNTLDEYFSISDVPMSFTQDFALTATNKLFNEFIKDKSGNGRNLLSELEEGTVSEKEFFDSFKKNIDKYFKENSEALKENAKLYGKYLARRKATELKVPLKDLPNEVKVDIKNKVKESLDRGVGIYENLIVQDYDNFKNVMKTLLQTTMSLSFEEATNEEDQAQRDEQEKEGTKSSIEYIPDAMKFDNFKSVSATIKLMIGSIVDAVYIPSTKTVQPVISDVTMMEKTGTYYKSLFNKFMNYLVNVNTPEAIKGKMENLINKVSQDETAVSSVAFETFKAQIKQFHDMVFGEGSIETEGQLKLIARFFNAFQKQKPYSYRLKSEIDNETKTDITFLQSDAFETISKSKAQQIGRNIIYSDLMIKPKFIFKQKEFKMDNLLDKPNFISALSDIGVDFDLAFLEMLNDEEYEALLDDYKGIVYEIQGLIKSKASPFKKNRNPSQLPFWGRINNIAEIYAKYHRDDTDIMKINPEGNAQNTIIDNNFISLLLTEAANAKSWSDFISNNPHLEFVYSQDSILLENIKNYLKNKAENRNFGNFPFISILSGEESNNRGKTTDKMTDAELFKARFNISFDTKGRPASYPIYENADSSRDYYLQTGQYFFINSDPNEYINRFKKYLKAEIQAAINFDSNVKNLNTDISVITIDGKTIKRKAGTSLGFAFTYLPSTVIEDIYAEIDLAKQGKNTNAEKILKNIDISKYVEEYLRNEADKEYESMKSLGYIIEKDGLVTTYMIDKDILLNNLSSTQPTVEAFKKLLKVRQVNNFTNINELSKVFFGRVQNIKSIEDGLKRYKNFLSERNTTLSHQPFNEAANKVLNNITVAVKEDKTTKNVNVKLKEGDIGYTNFKEQFNVIFVNDYIASNKSLTKLHEIEKKYNNIESSDGQSYATIDFLREILWKSGGKFTKTQEHMFQTLKAYERIKLNNLGNPYSKEERQRDLEILAPYLQKKEEPTEPDKYNLDDVLAPVSIVKPIHSGIIENQNETSPILIKTSSMPLSLYLVEGTRMEDIYVSMLRNDKQLLSFPSATKIGLPQGVVNIINSDGTTKDTSELPGYTLRTRDFGIQTETQNTKTTTTAGTQTMKILTSNLYSGGKPLNFKGTLEEWQALSEEEKMNNEFYALEINHREALKAIFNKNYEQLLENIGIKYRNGVIENVATNEITAYIKEQVMKHGVANNIVDQLDTDENGDKIVFYEMMSDYGLIKSIIFSMVDKGIISPKVNGSMKIQASVAFFERKDVPEDFKLETIKGKEIITSSRLKFYSQEGGVTQRMQVLMSSNMLRDINTRREKMKLPRLSKQELLEYLNKTDEGKMLLRGVGFRIPTQNMNSIDSFEIVDFLPDYMGDAIVVPAELPEKAGSDFDVDKLSVYLNNYKLNREGFPEYIKFDNDLSPEGVTRRYAKRWEKYQNLLLRINNSLDKEFEKLRKEEAKLGEAVNKLIDNVLSTEDSYFTEEEMNEIIKEKNLANLTIQQIEELAKIEEETRPTYKEFAQTSIYEQNSRQAVENNYFEAMDRIMMLPENFKRITKPNNSAIAEKVAEDIGKLKGIKPEPKDRIFNFSKLVSPVEALQNRIGFLEYKKLIGIAAVGVTSHSNMQKGLYVSLDNVPHNNLFKVNTVTLKDENGEEKEYNTISFTENVSDEDILDIIAMFVDGTVDVVKKPWLISFGADKVRFGATIMGIKYGMSLENIGVIISSPFVEEYARVKRIKSNSVSQINPNFIELKGKTYESWENYMLLQYNITRQSIPTSISEAKIKKLFSKVYEDGQFKPEKLKELEQSEIDLAFAMFDTFEFLEKTANNLRQVISTSNHETTHLKDNTTEEVKESVARMLSKKENEMFKVYENGKLTNAVDYLRKSTFVEPIIFNLNQFSNEVVYKYILHPEMKKITDRVIAQMSKDDNIETYAEAVQKYNKAIETAALSNFLFDSKIIGPTSSKGNRIVDNINAYTKMDEENPKSLYNFLKTLQAQVKNMDDAEKILTGMSVIDHIDVVEEPVEGRYYLKIKNRPSGTEIIVSNNLFNSFELLRANDNKVPGQNYTYRDIYNIIMMNSILRNGIGFSKNSLLSYMNKEDYKQLSEEIANMDVTDEFFDQISRNAIQNDYRKLDNIIDLGRENPFFGERQHINEQTKDLNSKFISGMNGIKLGYYTTKTGKNVNNKVSEYLPFQSWKNSFILIKDVVQFTDRKTGEKQEPFKTAASRKDGFYRMEKVGDQFKTYLWIKQPYSIVVEGVNTSIYVPHAVKGTYQTREYQSSPFSEINENPKGWNKESITAKLLELGYIKDPSQLIDSRTYQETPAFVTVQQAPVAQPVSTPTVNVIQDNVLFDPSLSKVNIYAGTGENAELSNFAIRPFVISGDKYQSVEQYFQLQKFQIAGVLEFDYDSPNAQKIADQINKIADEISKTSNGAKLKSLGGTRIPGTKLNEEFWNKIGSEEMKKAMIASFTQNPEALQKLLATGKSELTHKYNNVEQDKGRFSKLLMEVRQELSKPTDTNTISPEGKQISYDEYIDLTNFEENYNYEGTTRDIGEAILKSNRVVWYGRGQSFGRKSSEFESLESGLQHILGEDYTNAETILGETLQKGIQDISTVSIGLRIVDRFLRENDNFSGRIVKYLENEYQDNIIGIEYNHNNSHVYFDGQRIMINLAKGQGLKDNFEKKVEMITSEEVIHFVASNYLTEPIINKIYNELSEDEISKLKNLYNFKNEDKKNIVNEYVRIIIQDKFFGKTTEFEVKSTMQSIIDKIVKFLRDVFKTKPTSFSNMIINQIEEDIKNIIAPEGKPAIEPTC